MRRDALNAILPVLRASDLLPVTVLPAPQAFPTMDVATSSACLGSTSMPRANVRPAFPTVCFATLPSPARPVLRATLPTLSTTLGL